jgi:hypothetical protein
MLMPQPPTPATDHQPSAHPTSGRERIETKMIVEPTSIHSRSPLRHLLRAAAFVAPVTLLATVVVAGLLGPKPAQDTGVDASASVLAVVSPSAAPTRSSALTPDSAAPVLPPSLAGFPATFRSLAAVPPSAMVAAHLSAGGPPALAVVAGYLALIGDPTHCASPLVTFGAWCDRTGTIFQEPTRDGLSADGFRPPHLHLVVPAGVILPSSISGGATGAFPVEVLGRFAAAGSCRLDPAACEQGFVVERVVWANGADVALKPLLEPGQGTGISPTPPVTASQNVVTLLAVLARSATVARLDSVAGAAALRMAPIKGFSKGSVWYIRDVVIADDGSLLPRWLLMDALTGNLLATAPSDLPPLASLPQPSVMPLGS